MSTYLKSNLAGIGTLIGEINESVSKHFCRKLHSVAAKLLDSIRHVRLGQEGAINLP